MREVLIYVGEGRMHKGAWPMYHITTLRITIDWNSPRHLRGEQTKEVPFENVRAITKTVELPDGQFDLLLRLATSTVLHLQQLPWHAVKGVKQAVQNSRSLWQAKRDKMLKRVVY